MIFGGTSSRVLDSSLTTGLFIGKLQIKSHRKVAEGFVGHLGGMDDKKWDENKSR
jgi:hypothetical protein